MAKEEDYVNLGAIIDKDREKSSKKSKKNPGTRPVKRGKGASGKKVPKKRKKTVKRKVSKKKAETKTADKTGKQTSVYVDEEIETDVDKLYEMVRDKGIVKLREASKRLGIESDRVEEWGRVLEDHKLIKLHYPPVGEPVMILKKFKVEGEETEEAPKKKKKFKPGKNAFIINVVILLGFMAFMSFHFLGGFTIRVSYTQIYLALPVIIIIGLLLILKLKRPDKLSRIKELGLKIVWLRKGKRKKKEKGTGEK